MRKTIPRITPMFAQSVNQEFIFSKFIDYHYCLSGT